MPRALPAVLLLAACGSATPAPATPVTAAPRGEGDDRWAELDWAARHERMTFTVLPSLARRFRAHRDEGAATLACRTCHGDDAEAVRYRMPNGLPPLDPDALTGFEAGGLSKRGIQLG